MNGSAHSALMLGYVSVHFASARYELAYPQNGSPPERHRDIRRLEDSNIILPAGKSP
jgi:hypothetical protein